MKTVRNVVGAVFFLLVAIHGMPVSAAYNCTGPYYEQQGVMCHATVECQWDGHDPYYNWNNWENSPYCAGFDWGDLLFWARSSYNQFANIGWFECYDANPYTYGYLTVEWDFEGSC